MIMTVTTNTAKILWTDVEGTDTEFENEDVIHAVENIGALYKPKS